MALTVDFSNYDTYATDCLTQWDTNQTLRITGVTLNTAPTILFSNRVSVTCEPVPTDLQNGGVVSCDIPNGLLCEKYPITAYIRTTANGSTTTIGKIKIPIIPAIKPEDYDFIENITIITYESLMGKINSKVENSNYESKVAEIEREIAEILENGTTQEQITNAVRTMIGNLIADGTIANMTIEDNSITGDKLADGTITRDKLTDNVFDDVKIATDGYVDYYKTAEIVQSMYNPANGLEYKGGVSSIYRNLKVGKWYAYPCVSFSGYLGCVFFDDNENYLSGIVATKARTVNGYMKFKVPENTKKTIISMEWNDVSVVENFELFEVNENVELGETYISGIDGKPTVDMSIYEKMKKMNLLSDNDLTVGKMVSGSGSESNAAGKNLYTVECEELTNYTINYDPTDQMCMFFFYNISGDVISGLSHTFGCEDMGSEINFGNIGIGRILTTVTQKVINGVTHNLQTFTTPFGARIMKLTTAGSLRGKIVCVKGTAENWTPNNYRFEDTHTIAKPYADKVIYTLGDSITAGTHGGYQRYIRDITGASIVNYAYSGLTASSLSDKVCTNDVDFKRAAAVTIMIGTNGGVGNSTIEDVPYIIGGTAADIEAGKTLRYNEKEISTVEAYWSIFNQLKYHAAIAKIIEWVHWKNHDCEIYLLTPLPNAFRGLTLDGGHEEIRTALCELNKLYAVPVVDLVRESGVCLHSISEYTYDDTHYNEKGNKAVGTYVGHRLNSD